MRPRAPVRACLPHVIFILLTLPRASSSVDAFTKTVTQELNNLLSSGYDKRIRPGFGGPPTKVTVNMHLKSLGPVSENDESYTMDVYFRQTWFDRRLTFNLTGVDELSMSWLFLDKVWKPDTFFTNGKKSYLHRITSPNKFLRVRKDGFLTYSMRLTISATCKMYLRKFPLDSQKCSLIIGSYGYTSEDMVYNWADSGVGLEKGLEMAQYDLVNISIQGMMYDFRGRDEFSIVQANFYLRRSTGYFLLQIYVPCSLIVSSSWVSFWINPTDVAGRVSLGVTTVLSITTMGFGGRAQLPKVPYATALDWFIIVCFSFAFAVLVEYAMINFTDKLTSDIRKLLEERAKRKKSEEMKKQEIIPNQGPRIVIEQIAISEETLGEAIKDIDEESEWCEESGKQRTLHPRRWYSVPSIFAMENFRPEDWLRQQAADSERQDKPTQRFHYIKETFLVPVRFWKSVHFLPREEDVDIAAVPVHKFSKIDIAARRIFPLSFSLFLITYGCMYTFYIPDKVMDS